MDHLHKDIITIPAGKVELEGEMIIPYEAKGLIIFSHGSGSSRFSSRNNMVAMKLRHHNFGTLLFDLLTEEEDQVYSNRFDISLLTNRLVAATEFLMEHDLTKSIPLSYFGASTGAASALRAAAEIGPKIKAVVSRGGRPDLAMDKLAQVKSPVMLIVGSLDTDVISLNQLALRKLGSAKKELEIIPGASHLFEEPGKLEKVADLAADWYEKFVADKVIA
jgi:pimeloyl-ACP methyl ester carboxylesterase